MSLRPFFALTAVACVVGALGAAGYYWIAKADERRESSLLAERHLQIQLALVSHLGDLPEPKLETVVAGREVKPRIWDFRAAAVMGPEKIAPVYGRAALRCDQTFDRPECWSLTELAIDGEHRVKLEGEALALALTPASEASAPPPRPAISPEEAPETNETAAAEAPAEKPTEPTDDAAETVEETDQGADQQAAEVAVETVETDAGPATDVATETAAETTNGNDDALAESVDAVETAAAAEQATSEPSSAPQATHTIRVSEANGRAAPSKDGRILAIVSEGQKLEKIGAKGSWGEFKVLGGEQDGVVVWVYDRLVEPEG